MCQEVGQFFNLLWIFRISNLNLFFLMDVYDGFRTLVCNYPSLLWSIETEERIFQCELDLFLKIK